MTGTVGSLVAVGRDSLAVVEVHGCLREDERWL